MTDFKEFLSLTSNYIPYNTDTTYNPIKVVTTAADAAMASAIVAGWWRLCIAQQAAYVNIGAAATAANILIPVGLETHPVWRPGGVYHFLGFAAGPGEAALIPCFPV